VGSQLQDATTRGGDSELPFASPKHRNTYYHTSTHRRKHHMLFVPTCPVSHTSTHRRDTRAGASQQFCRGWQATIVTTNPVQHGNIACERVIGSSSNQCTCRNCQAGSQTAERTQRGGQCDQRGPPELPCTASEPPLRTQQCNASWRCVSESPAAGRPMRLPQYAETGSHLVSDSVYNPASVSTLTELFST
jgi:hypothetical protein